MPHSICVADIEHAKLREIFATLCQSREHVLKKKNGASVGVPHTIETNIECRRQ